MTLSARYNTRVTVQRPVKARADNGEQTLTMQTVVTRWGRMESQAGAEQQTAAMEVRATQRWLVKLRYESALAAMSPEWQLVEGGRVLRITAVDNVSKRNRDLIVSCVEDV